MKKNIPGTDYQLFIEKGKACLGIIHLVRDMYDKPDINNYTFGRSLEGRVALVTGGYKGIGYSIARKLRLEGASVIITGRSEANLERATKELGNMAAYMVWDISKHNEIEGRLVDAEKLFGPISILVNNAGVTGDNRGRIGFENMDEQHIHFVHNVNLIGTKIMCECFLKKNSEGTILNIISNTGTLPASDAYQTSKWALYSYTKGLAELLTNNGSKVTVNGLCPGPIKTDMSFNRGTSLFRREIPNRRIGLPEEIAELAFVQLMNGLNNQNGFITICDGGESL